MLSPKEAKRLDGIFTDAAFEGVNLRGMDIRHDDNDFAFVMGAICKSHGIQVGSLFSKSDISDMAQKNCPANLGCMMYMLRDEADDREKIDFVQFYSPEMLTGTAHGTLGAIAKMLTDNYDIPVDVNIEKTPGRKSLPIPLDRFGKHLEVEHIPSKQPYYHMALSAEATQHLRDNLQDYLDSMLANIATAPKQNKPFYMSVNQYGTKSFPLKVAGDDDKGAIAIISPDLRGRTMNEHIEARFFDLGKEIVQRLRDVAPELRVTASGTSIMVEGAQARTQALKSLNFVDKISKLPTPSGTWKALSKPAVSEVERLVKPDVPAPQEGADGLKAFLQRAAFLSIRANRTELLGDSIEELNPKGKVLQGALVDGMIDYLSQQGVTTIEQLIAKDIKKDVTTHYTKMVPHLVKFQSAETVLQSDAMSAVHAFVTEARKLELKNQHGGPGEAAGNSVV